MMAQQLIKDSLSAFLLIPLFTILAPALSMASVDAPKNTKTGELSQVLDNANIQSGLIVQIGCGDGQLLVPTDSEGRFLIHGLDTKPDAVRQAREHLHKAGCYGQVSVARFDGKRLPYVDNLVNVVVFSVSRDIPMSEALRVLAPGGVACERTSDNQWVVTTKPWPKDIDQWTHYLHAADNNAVAADRKAAEPRSIQWASRPLFGRSHEELASMSVTVSANGRVFFIVDEAPYASIRFLGQWRLVARDAFNGTLLWKQDIPDWNDHLRHFRSGPVHLQRRLTAVGDRVYTTLGLSAPVTAISAVTGKTEITYEGTEYTEEILVDGGVVYLVVGTSENQRIGGGLFRRGEPERSDFRYILALDEATGRRLWEHEFTGGEYLLPLTLAVREGSVYYQSTRGVARLDATSGEVLWKTPRPTPARRMAFSAPTLVVDEKVVLCADREAIPEKPQTGLATNKDIEWGVHGWNEPNYPRGGPSRVRVYSIETGKELWDAPCSEQYNAPTDIFVVDGIAWIGSNFRGYNVETGDLVKELNWKGAPVAMPHHRCYRNKATENFIFTGRSGVEVVSLEDGWVGNNSWIRGTCQYGVMPANGLVYAPPNACACYNKVRVRGYFAAASKRTNDLKQDGTSKQKRLDRGAAYQNVIGQSGSARDLPDGAWPMYRRDNRRSGCVGTSIADNLQSRWSVRLGGRLTQPIAVGSTVYIAATDAHTIYALATKSGKKLWHFTAGGRIDSAPTYYRGTILFGCADGSIYCVEAATGQLAWRYLAAPKTQLVSAYDQLESTWPVHGAVLVQDETLYAVAGRNSYLDGGMTLCRLDPASGEELSRTTIYHLDPETGRQIGREGSRGFDMEGVRNDVLSADGHSVFLKHFRFDREGRQQDETVPHLFSIYGFLDPEWFVRDYWILGTGVGAGWGGWANAAASAPAGRILAIGDTAVFGYGRVAVSSGPVGHKADAYHLWCRNIPSKATVSAAATSRPKKGTKTLAPPLWSDTNSLTVRAMALTSGKLLVAGPPDLGKKNKALLAFDNEREALAAFQGKRGVFLRVVSIANGETQAEYRLPALPGFDGMSAAHGKVFLSLENGTLMCWGKQ